MEEKGIKELSELLDGIEILLVAGKKIAADGINKDDLTIVFELFNQFSVLKEAFTGLKELPAEIKDIDEAELLMLGTKLYSIIKSLKEA